MKPTEEQVKKFWEHWGFYKEEYPEPDIKWLYRSPDHTYISFRGYPPIDLNNLFKWAVPKLQDNGYQIDIVCFEESGFSVAVFNVIHEEQDIYDANNRDPALALFWAIYKVIEEEK